MLANADCVIDCIGLQTAGVVGGSVMPMLVAQCMDGLTQSRIKAFEGYLNCKEGDLSCPVPAAN